MIYGGPIIFDLADAATVMRWYREFQSSAPDEFYIFLGLQTVPPGDPFPKEHWGKKMCALLVSHNGPIAEAEKAVNAVRAALPKPIIDWAGPMPYPALQTLFDGLYPKGLQWYWKGDFVKTLPDAAIDAHLAQTAKLPSPVSAMHLYPIDGAVHRRKQDATAWNCRDATWSMVIVGVDSDPNEGPGPQEMGAGLLGGGPSVRSRWRIPEFHDGRRGRGAPEGDLRRQLPAPRRAEEEIRSRPTSSE